MKPPYLGRPRLSHSKAMKRCINSMYSSQSSGNMAIMFSVIACRALWFLVSRLLSSVDVSELFVRFTVFSLPKLEPLF